MTEHLCRFRDQAERLRTLVQALLDNDPDDMAADGVTVLDVWRKEAARILASEVPHSPPRQGSGMGHSWAEHES